MKNFFRAFLVSSLYLIFFATPLSEATAFNKNEQGINVFDDHVPFNACLEQSERSAIFIDSHLEDKDVLRSGFTEASNKVFHLFSHGRPGELLIEGHWRNAEQIASWLQLTNSLKSKSHFNIYGCNFAQGEKGRTAVEYLEATLGITVAASDDITGVNGDWDLEVGNFKNGVKIQEYSHNLQQGTLPIQPGMAATTCGSFTEANQFSSVRDGYVFGIFDIRDPGCAGTPGASAPNAPSNWANSGGANSYHDPRWTNENLGEIFGVELEYDQASSPDIFLSSGGLTNIGVGTNPSILPMVGGTGGEVFRIDGTTGDITVVATLPNHTFIHNATFANSGEKFVGLGNLSYNAIQKKLYVTNLEDGNIYVVDATTTSTIDQVYDPTPGSADITALDHTQRERMVYGIEYNKCNGRVYYSRPNGLQADIFSVGLNADGTIDNSVAPVLHHSFTTSAPENGTEGSLVSDIEFSDDCTQMLTSERELSYYQLTLSLWAHHAGVQIHDVSGATWTTGVTYDIGTVKIGSFPYVFGRNAGGGVSFGYSNYGSCDPATACSDAMVATGDALVFADDSKVYGLQISDLAGTSSYPDNSYFIDLDGNTGGSENWDKFTNYDVDVFGGSECFVSCTAPSNLAFTQSAPTCAGATGNDNGSISLSGHTDGTHYGVSTLGATTYDGPTSITGGTAATAIGTLPQIVQSNVPNTGGSYIIRIFNGADDCYTDDTVTVAAVICSTCILNMSQTSTCSESGGVYTSTYDLTLNWTGPTATGDLTITLTGDGTLNTSTVPAATIAAGSTTTLTGAFTIPADGNGTTTITATFDDDATCTTSWTTKAPLPCPTDAFTGTETGTGEICDNVAATEIGGTVFEDWNSDGLMNQSDTIGVAGIQVLAYDCDGNVAGTTYSDLNGNYKFVGLTSGESYRVEFILPESVSCWAKPTQSGADNGTTVQFVASGNCANLGVASPSDYCVDGSAKIITTCFVSGNSLVSGAETENEPTVLSLNYQAASLGDGKLTTGTASQTGSVWGVAYDVHSEALYMAAVLKRHSGLGPNGLGAIYSYDPNNSTPSLFYDLASFVPVGSIPDNPTRGLVGTASSASHDVEAFAKVGKVGLGDIDLSSDGSTLYVVNLFDGLIYAIDVNNPGSAPVSLPPLPEASCNNGQARPWGLEYYRGNLYASQTCTAEDGGSRNDLKASVYRYDGQSWSNSILEIPLNFTRGCANWGGSNSDIWCNWNPWVDDWSDFSGEYTQPTPILSDIEFDNGGNMILGFLDRTGNQLGHNNYSTDVTDFGTYRTNQGGDILKASNTNGTYILENNGTVGNQVSSGSNSNGDPWNGSGGANTGQGPGGGEFFWGDYINFDGSPPGGPNEGGQHSELASGGLAIHKGNNEVLVSSMDPNGWDQGGVVWYNSFDGSRNYGLTLYEGNQSGGLFGKAVGIGDVELMCDAAPIEIGNRIWVDADNDGIQDACESGLDGVTVQLYDRNCTQVAQTTTANGGLYYFNATNVDTIDYAGTPAAGFTGLTYNTNYFIVVGDGQYASNELTVSGTIYAVSTTDAGTNDNIDSDGSEGIACGSLASLPFKEVNTADAGCNDHSYDFGYVPTATYSLGNRVFVDTNKDGDQDAGETGIDGVTLQLLNGDGSVYDSDAAIAGDQALTVTTAGGGYYRFDDLPAGTYVVEVLATNLVASAILDGYLSSRGSSQEASPNDDVDQNDNGLDVLVSGAVRSGIVTLASPEVTGESDEPTTYTAGSTAPTAATAAADAQSNLTVDFGFYLCEPPTAITFTQVAATCTGATAINDGSITLAGHTDGTHYGVSTLGATTYDGPTSITGGTAATAIVGTPVIHSTVPNTGGSYIVRIFNGADSCYSDETVTVAEVICYPCSITASGLTTPACNNGNTGSNEADDYITFDLNPTGISLGSNYTLTVSGGATITPSTGTYGSATSFQLQAGSAGAGDVTVTITDDTDATCTLDVLIADPGSCSNDRIDLELRKVADKSVAKIGDDILFTLELKNEGNITANNIVVNDDLPSSVTFKSANSSTGSYDETTGEWSIDSLEASHSLQLFILAELTQDTIVCNITEVIAVDEPDIDSSPNNDDGDQSEDDEDKALVFVTPEIDLSVTKVVSQNLVAVGDAISYTISVKNDGPSIAHNVKLLDQLPAGLALVSANSVSDQSAATWNYTADTLTMDSISVGETITLTVNATVASINSAITNCAEIVAANEDDVDSTPGNAATSEEDDEACATINPIEYDIELLKDILKDGYVLGNRKVKVGDEITYVLNVTNFSSSGLTGVMVKDLLPAGVEFQTMSGDGTYDEPSGEWTIGNISPKSQLRMEIVVKVTSDGTISNTAEVSAMDQADKDSIPGNGVETEDDQETVTMEVVKPKKKLEIKVGS